MTGRRFQTSILDDINRDLWDEPSFHQRVTEAYDKVVYNTKKLCAPWREPMEQAMKKISMFRVYAVYGESPERPLIFRPKDEFAFGADEDEAVLRSGIYIVIAAARKEPTTEPLDPRYVTIVVERVGDIKTP